MEVGWKILYTHKQEEKPEATRFVDADRQQVEPLRRDLLFAGTNEPNVDTAQKMVVLKSYLQTFIDAVRATGGNNAVRNLIVQGPNTDIDMTHNLFGCMPTDVVPIA